MDKLGVDRFGSIGMVKRRDDEQPAAIARYGWRYHHMGIPTSEPHPDELYLKPLKMYVRGFDVSPFGIEWMRFESGCQVHELVRTVPHVAFEVDDLEEALKGCTLLGGISSPSPGVRAAMIMDDGAPVELIEFSGRVEAGPGHPPGGRHRVSPLPSRSPMEQPVLTDKDQFPAEGIIFSHIGRSRALWLSLFDHVHRDYPDFTEQWRYYRDGKSWLLKVSRKTRTIFWLSVVKGSFRTTFYFTEKAEQAILRSSLPDELKRQYRTGKRRGRLCGLTILHRHRRDVEHAKRLIAIKTGTR